MCFLAVSAEHARCYSEVFLPLSGCTAVTSSYSVFYVVSCGKPWSTVILHSLPPIDGLMDEKKLSLCLDELNGSQCTLTGSWVVFPLVTVTFLLWLGDTERK